VRADLTTQVSDLTTEKNTAYYIVGTRDELIK
jgi:ribosomal protein L7Ae-like RNA K-turn-binding protein